MPVGQKDQALSELLRISPAQILSSWRQRRDTSHLSAFFLLGPDFMDCARWSKQRRGKDWWFSAGLSVPDWEEHVCTSPKAHDTGLNTSAEKSSTGFRCNVELLLQDMLLIQHTWNSTYCKLPPLSLQCCLVKVRDVFHGTAWKKMGACDCFSLWETVSLVIASVASALRLWCLHGYLAWCPFPVLHVSPGRSVPVCARLCASQGRDSAFGLTSSNLWHHKRRFFAFLSSGFSWISHPYLVRRTESFWLSGPTLEPFLWANVAHAIFPSLAPVFIEVIDCVPLEVTLQCDIWIPSRVNSMQS